MNLKSSYVKSWLEEEIKENTVAFVMQQTAAEIVEKIIADNPELKKKQRFDLEKLETVENIRCLATAEYIIADVELPTFFSKREGQTYIFISYTKEWNANLTRLLLHADYIIEHEGSLELPKNMKTIIDGQIVPSNNYTFIKRREQLATSKAKKNIVMYCGGFKNNGITSSALNLMKNLNKDKYQIIVIEQEKLPYYEALNFKKIPEHVIKIQIPGNINIAHDEEEVFLDFHCHPLEHLMKNGPTGFLTDEIKTIYQRELQRVLGNIEIDIALDFDGYFKYWTLLLASSNSPRKIIYQHNEMMQEYSKKLGKAYKHRSDLNIIFPLYNYFDVIVSVAKQTGEVNKQHLEHVVQDTSKMTYIHNSIDYEAILSSAKEDNDIEIPSDTFNFVTMGRLSPEKTIKG